MTTLLIHLSFGLLILSGIGLVFYGLRPMREQEASGAPCWCDGPQLSAPTREVLTLDLKGNEAARAGLDLGALPLDEGLEDPAPQPSTIERLRSMLSGSKRRSAPLDGDDSLASSLDLDAPAAQDNPPEALASTPAPSPAEPLEPAPSLNRRIEVLPRSESATALDLWVGEQIGAKEDAPKASTRKRGDTEL